MANFPARVLIILYPLTGKLLAMVVELHFLIEA
jgi:hypothetical protein